MTDIKVCDAIMGTGKTSAAINYINNNLDRKFIYITPYISEATRIADACPLAKFCEPQRKSLYHGSKILHTIDLIEQGRNVATTHQAFKNYPPELLDSLRSQRYILIIDENVEVLNDLHESSHDIELLKEAGYIEEYTPNTYRLVKDGYSGVRFRDLFRVLRTREIISIASGKGSDGDMYFYWQLPPELISAFDEVIVLTYLFEGQGLYHFFKMYDIPYRYIGIRRDEAGFFFSETENYVPEYVHTLRDKLHIIENPSLNRIGDKPTALSMNWFASKKDSVEQLKNNLYNYFRHICHTDDPKERMWGAFTGNEYDLRGKGYARGFLSFNTRARNDLKHKTVLAYCVNLYMNVGQRLYLSDHGVDVDEDKYALSTMLQWIWRSAIRDGHEIWVYIPSKRMRDLLNAWIREVSDVDSM